MNLITEINKNPAGGESMSEANKKDKRAKIEIDEHFCKGCGLCVDACPQHLISITDQVSAKGYYPAQCKDPDNKCTGCALCARVCPDVAIEVFLKKKDSVVTGGKE
jgi:2-oxoglutarate ferredoxin oxidoreductase subunit delta